jgi:hypothetical protein
LISLEKKAPKGIKGVKGFLLFKPQRGPWGEKYRVG